MAIIETRVGLQAAMGGDRTKAAYPATPVSVEELARHAAFLAAGARAIHLTSVRRGMIAQVSSRPAAAQHLRDLARLRRVRDRIDREYAQPLDVEALARGAYMSGGHFSREFRRAYGESPYGYLMTRRIERAMALLGRGELSVSEVCFAVGCSSVGTFSTRFSELVGVPPSVYRRQGARDGGDALLRGETGYKTDQESRSAGPEPHVE